MSNVKGYLSLPKEKANKKLTRVLELDNICFGLCASTREMAINPKTKISYCSKYPYADFYTDLNQIETEDRVVYEVLTYGKLCRIL